MDLTYPPPVATCWTLWRYCDIESEINPGQVYLRRLRIVQTPWFGVYVHWINEPDSGRDLHDHPWNFWSLILRGGYTEEISLQPGAISAPLRWHRWSAHHMPLLLAHRITDVDDGTVTLVIVGPRVREWSFWTSADKVPWRQYIRNRRREEPA